MSIKSYQELLRTLSGVRFGPVKENSRLAHIVDIDGKKPLFVAPDSVLVEFFGRFSKNGMTSPSFVFQGLTGPSQQKEREMFCAALFCLCLRANDEGWAYFLGVSDGMPDICYARKHLTTGKETKHILEHTQIPNLLGQETISEKLKYAKEIVEKKLNREYSFRLPPHLLVECRLFFSWSEQIELYISLLKSIAIQNTFREIWFLHYDGNISSLDIGVSAVLVSADGTVKCWKAAVMKEIDSHVLRDGFSLKG